MFHCINRPHVYVDLRSLATISHSGEITIGRTSKSTIPMDDPEVPSLLSRQHAIIKMPQGGCGAPTLTDQGSLNGTYVSRANGKKMCKLWPSDTWTFEPNDRVSFGGCEEVLHPKTGARVANPFFFMFHNMIDKDEQPSALMDIIRQHLTCSICQGVLQCTQMLQCGHMFCLPCISKWLDRCTDKTCPSCRSEVKTAFARCYTLDALVKDLTHQ
eukprot:gene7162-273_t